MCIRDSRRSYQENYGAMDYVSRSISLFFSNSIPLPLAAKSLYTRPSPARNHFASGSANEKIFAPEAIATYCLPSTSYVIGDAFIAWFVSKCHRYLSLIHI